MTRSRQNVLIPYLAVVVAGLVGLNWWLATAPIDTSPIVPEPLTEVAATAEVPATSHIMPSLPTLSETLSRPLFRSDRRPPTAKVTPVNTTADAGAAPAPSADALRLVGMMRSGTSARRALIRVTGTPNAAWVEQGSEIGGWVIATINEDTVSLERNGDKAVLKLFQYKPAEPAQQKVQ